MKRLITTILILLAILVGISAYALYANRVPWKTPPGFMARLSVYLGRNVAQTSDDAAFPELRPRQYPVPAKAMFDQLPDVIGRLGWDIQSVDSDRMAVGAVVTTRWVKFRDDITITVIPVQSNTCSLAIRSASRVGRGDFGANLGHILRLYEQIETLGPAKK